MEKQSEIESLNGNEVSNKESALAKAVTAAKHYQDKYNEGKNKLKDTDKRISELEENAKKVEEKFKLRQWKIAFIKSTHKCELERAEQTFSELQTEINKLTVLVRDAGQMNNEYAIKIAKLEQENQNLNNIIASQDEKLTEQCTRIKKAAEIMVGQKNHIETITQKGQEMEIAHSNVVWNKEQEIQDLVNENKQVLLFAEQLKDTSQFVQDDNFPLINQLADLKEHLKKRLFVAKTFYEMVNSFQDRISTGRLLTPSLSSSNDHQNDAGDANQDNREVISSDPSEELPAKNTSSSTNSTAKGILKKRRLRKKNKEHRSVTFAMNSTVAQLQSSVVGESCSSSSPSAALEFTDAVCQQSSSSINICSDKESSINGFKRRHHEVGVDTLDMPARKIAREEEYQIDENDDPSNGDVVNDSTEDVHEDDDGVSDDNSWVDMFPTKRVITTQPLSTTETQLCAPSPRPPRLYMEITDEDFLDRVHDFDLIDSSPPNLITYFEERDAPESN